MIRKVVIIVLTLAVVGTGMAWPISYPGISVGHATYTTPDKHRIPARSVRLLAVNIVRGVLVLRNSRLPATAVEGDWAQRFRASCTPGWRVNWRLDPRISASVCSGSLWRPDVLRPHPDTVVLTTPLWLTTLLFATYPAIAFLRGPLRRWHRRRRRRRGLCIKCSYDLTANVSGVCPECGTEVELP